MALLRSEPVRTERWVPWLVPSALAGLLLLAGSLTAAATSRPALAVPAGIAWGAVVVPLLAWAVALRVRRARYRRGLRRVGQWVRCARMQGGQIDGLAAVRAGGPLSSAEVAHGWLSLEAEVLRFSPVSRSAAPEAAWSVPWEALAVVEVRPDSELRTRLVPGLRRSVVTLRFRGRSADLRLLVDDDASALLRAWHWWGVGERAVRTRRAER